MSSLKKFSKQKLSKEQLKSIKGGTLSCSLFCPDAGHWYATYANYDHLMAQVDAYCPSGGAHYQCIEPE
jgi:natural product precursor